MGNLPEGYTRTSSYYDCRYAPPTVVMANGDISASSAWPQTTAEEWCRCHLEMAAYIVQEEE